MDCARGRHHLNSSTLTRSLLHRLRSYSHYLVVPSFCHSFSIQVSASAWHIASRDRGCPERSGSSQPICPSPMRIDAVASFRIGARQPLSCHGHCAFRAHEEQPEIKPLPFAVPSVEHEEQPAFHSNHRFVGSRPSCVLGFLFIPS